MSRAREFADLAGSADAGGLTGRNMIINGGMQVAQRGTSETGVTGSGYKKAPDRFKFSIASAGTWTVSQSTTAPSEFSNSYKVACTTADASLAAGDNLIIEQRFEGQNLQHLKYGTSDARNITLSFWVRSAKTGTYSVTLEHNVNGGTNRLAGDTYTINTANTWEYKTITIAGDTTVNFENDSSTNRLIIYWWLAAGSTWTSGTHASVWEDVVNGNYADSNQVNLADSTSNDWHITGVKLEVGEKATPFEYRSFGDELAKCQRYFCKSFNYSVAPGATSSDGAYISNVARASSNQNYWHVEFPVEMRAKATAKHYSPDDGSGTAIFYNYSDSTNYASAAANTGAAGMCLRPNSGTGQDLGDVIGFHWTADAEL